VPKPGWDLRHGHSQGRPNSGRSGDAVPSIRAQGSVVGGKSRFDCSHIVLC